MLDCRTKKREAKPASPPPPFIFSFLFVRHWYWEKRVGLKQSRMKPAPRPFFFRYFLLFLFFPPFFFPGFHPTAEWTADLEVKKQTDRHEAFTVPFFPPPPSSVLAAPTHTPTRDRRIEEGDKGRATGLSILLLSPFFSSLSFLKVPRRSVLHKKTGRFSRWSNYNFFPPPLFPLFFRPEMCGAI